MDINVLVILVYILHPTPIQGTRFSSALISPFTKQLQGAFRTGSDGMQDIQKNSWRKRWKKIIIPIIYKPNFFQSFAWVLRGTSYRQTHLTTAVWRETWRPVEMHPKRTSLNSSQTTCTFLRKQTDKQNPDKQTPIKKPQRPRVIYKVLCMDKDSNFPCAFPMGSRSIL